MTTLRVAIAGCGAVSGILPLRVFPELQGQVVPVAAVDPRVDRAQAFAKEVGARRAHASLAEALSYDDFEAVDIRTPHHLHATVALEALAAGKHVLVEKPMATNLADARAMIDAARQAGVVLAVAENYAFLAGAHLVRRLLADGVIGVVLAARTQRVCDIEGIWTRDGWRTDALRTGGGVLLDQGCHQTNLLRGTLGRVVAVHAMATSRRPGWVGEDSVSVQCRLADGPVVQQLYCWGSPTPALGAEASYYGTEGSIELHMGYGQDPGGVWLHRPGRDAIRLGDVSYDDTFTPIVADWVRACTERGTPTMSGEEGFADLAVVAAGYRSLESGGVEPVEDL